MAAVWSPPCLARRRGRPIRAHVGVDLLPIVVQLIEASPLIGGRKTNVLDVAVDVNDVRVANVVGVTQRRLFGFFGASSAAGLEARLPAPRFGMPPTLLDTAAYSNRERFFAAGLLAAKTLLL